MNNFWTKLLNRIKKIVNSNIFLLVISFVCAWALWFYVNGYYNPNDKTDFDDIPVTIAMEGSIPDQNGLTILSKDDVNVDIRVSGPRIYLANLKKDSISVTVDLDSVTGPGNYSLPIKINLPNSDKLTIANQSASKMNISFDIKDQKTVPVEIQTMGVPVEGYMIGNITPSPSSVTIVGPKQILDTVDSIPIEVDISTLTSGITLRPQVIITDRNGSVVGSNVSSDFDMVSVNVPVYKIKEIPLSVALVNNIGGSDEAVVSYEINPSSIRVAGNESDLQEYNQLILGTIDTSRYDNDASVSFDLVSPSGLTIIDEVKSVSVKLTYGTYHTKSFEIPAASVVLNNLPDGIKATVSEPITVKLRGVPNVVDAINVEDITANIDMGTVTATNGTVTQPVTFTFKNDVGNKVGVHGKYTAAVNINKQ